MNRRLEAIVSVVLPEFLISALINIEKCNFTTELAVDLGSILMRSKEEFKAFQ